MPEFGQCSESTCNEIAVRLFDCAHHCMKQVCLQHLIEHDRMIEHNQDYLDNLRTELVQLWSTYTSLVDETKLHLEFEQKLKKHQQLIRDISNLFEINSMNIEHYRLMMEKLKQNIEQEKQFNQYSIESYPRIEEVKIEPNDIISSTDELDSLNISLVTRIDRLNSGIEQQRESISDSSSTDECDHKIHNTYENTDHETINIRTRDYPTIRTISGECPFWFDGAYGLTENSHGMYICSRRRHKELHRHLIRFHKLTYSSVDKICQAIRNNEDPFQKILFNLDDLVIDQINHIYCPFSIYNNQSTEINNSSERSCRSTKPQLSYALRYHLTRDHRMSMSNAKKLVYKLKTNSEN